MSFVLRPGALSLADLRELGAPGKIALDPAAAEPIAASAATVAAMVAEGARVYGVTTGFGSLARKAISSDQTAELQRRLVLSHAAGTGPALGDATVRRILALKIAGLARGHSGVRPALVEALIALYNADVLPVIPAQGSVGASGDLAPLAHLAALLIGAGEARFEGARIPAAAGLARAGLAPMTLAAKEGLALLNGTQVSTALALDGLYAIADAFAAAVVAGALSVDAVKGSDTPFDARISELRGHPGQIALAAAYRGLLAGSAIRDSHLDCDRVQDPYSLRCQPQVMGACLDQLRFAAQVLEREANGVTDNPLVFAADAAVLSGGNFHAEPVALAADVMALAAAEVGAISERRIALLTDANLSGLPPFLVARSGLNSGFMIAQVVAAALAGENRQRAAPASIDSLPTSANQEDHVSMATHGARRLAEMAENTAGIAAIELLAAAQGVEFHRPLRSSPALEEAIALVRERAAALDEDRLLAPDIAAIKDLIREGVFRRFLPAGLLPDAPAVSR